MCDLETTPRSLRGQCTALPGIESLPYGSGVPAEPDDRLAVGSADARWVARGSEIYEELVEANLQHA
jgi:hypothetical protein